MRSLSMRSGERAGVRGAVALSTISSLAFACSGEGASAAMARASLVGLTCFVLSVTATIFSVTRARKLAMKMPKIAAAIAVLLVALHPTIWLGVTSGDCGQALLVAGPVFAVLHGGIAGSLMLAKR